MDGFCANLHDILAFLESKLPVSSVWTGLMLMALASRNLVGSALCRPPTGVQSSSHVPATA